MRTAAIALALLVWAGCKDKPEAAPAPGAAQPQQHPAPARPALETPEIVGPGLVRTTQLGPKVTFSNTEVQLDGEVVISLAPDGALARDRLDTLTRMLERKAITDAPVAITLDAALPYRRIGPLLDAFNRAGFRNLALLAGPSSMIPIELPDSAKANRGGVRPVVTLDRNRLTLWSASGQEGTKNRPKLATMVGDRPSFAPITEALAEIVRRRWPDGKRADEDRTIIIQLDGAQPAQTLLGLLAAVRSDGSRELFPNIFLAGGI